jgi:hypothetical protein
MYAIIRFASTLLTHVSSFDLSPGIIHGAQHFLSHPLQSQSLYSAIYYSQVLRLKECCTISVPRFVCSGCRCLNDFVIVNLFYNKKARFWHNTSNLRVFVIFSTMPMTIISLHSHLPMIVRLHHYLHHCLVRSIGGSCAPQRSKSFAGSPINGYS